MSRSWSYVRTWCTYECMHARTQSIGTTYCVCTSIRGLAKHTHTHSHSHKLAVLHSDARTFHILSHTNICIIFHLQRIALPHIYFCGCSCGVKTKEFRSQFITFSRRQKATFTLTAGQAVNNFKTHSGAIYFSNSWTL